jgi:hypothetical protein
MAPSSVQAASDDGSIVFGWLGRITIILGILALVTFETLSIAVAKVDLQDTGSTAAQSALESYAQNQNADVAYEIAEAYVEQHDSKIVKKTFVITPQSVTFDVKRTAPTLVLYRWSETAGWAKIRTTIYAEPMVSDDDAP